MSGFDRVVKVQYFGNQLYLPLESVVLAFHISEIVAAPPCKYSLQKSSCLKMEMWSEKLSAEYDIKLLKQLHERVERSVMYLDCRELSNKVLIIIGRCKRCAFPQLLFNLYIDHMVHESGSSKLQQQRKKHIMTVQKERSKQGRID